MSFSCPADLTTEATELAKSLGSLKSFLDAARSLLASIRSMSSELFQQQIRKIITLVEIARGTLVRAGVKLHTFTSCSPPLQPLKSEYFAILRVLKERHRDIVDRKDRANKLLLALDSWLIIRRCSSSSEPSSPIMGASVSASIWPPPPPTPVSTTEAVLDQTKRTPSSRAPAELMPPPAHLPWEYRAPSPSPPRGRSTQRSERRHDSRPYARTRNPRTRWPDPEDGNDGGDENEQDENEELPVVRLPSRPLRRFGIFCTGAKSGHERRERSSRSNSLRG
ncbi:uncharacterized protein STEHIDRAFT_148460 [Stereum hirsutum FP-91666 SS1]|uniref:uncharacterized protein n=1 Tax=Stereum hirsutum (strain FP-91666) TaxID=721885 RepID=UPI00044495B8|nr:uncharacterized protein STEHIDRAFT_148460 [Stereum hirsutum FP-91666 SS1]EIM84395.1 hypothetical protein STEHIDRAFT_148460 [Stereum hirsutum FP-91666 SS1]